MHLLGKITLGVFVAGAVWLNWSTIASDYTWHQVLEQAAKDTGAKYRLIKITALHKPWTWIYPPVEVVSFYRPTETMDGRATYGVAGQAYRADGRASKSLFYVYLDCDRKIVKEVDATNITDDEARVAIFTLGNFELKEGKWLPKPPFVITQRFYSDFCDGQPNGYKTATEQS
jgi:hypothetical protein